MDMMGKNWVTTLGGIIAGLGQIAEMAPIPPQYSFIPKLVTATGALIVGIGAKDWNVHSTPIEVKEAGKEEAVIIP